MLNLISNDLTLLTVYLFSSHIKRCEIAPKSTNLSIACLYCALLTEPSISIPASLHTNAGTLLSLIKSKRFHALNVNCTPPLIMLLTALNKSLSVDEVTAGAFQSKSISKCGVSGLLFQSPPQVIPRRAATSAHFLKNELSEYSCPLTFLQISQALRDV